MYGGTYGSSPKSVGTCWLDELGSQAEASPGSRPGGKGGPSAVLTAGQLSTVQPSSVPAWGSTA